MRRCRINLPNRCYHLISRVSHCAFLHGAILEKDKYVRIGCCIVLSAWFVLALFGFSEWAMFWSV
jgi:hypothetical protein